MERLKKRWKIARLGNGGEGSFPPSLRVLPAFLFLALVLVFMITMGVLQSLSPSAVFAEELSSANASSNGKTKGEQSRQILIEVERLKMELAEKLMKKKQVDMKRKFRCSDTTKQWI